MNLTNYFLVAMPSMQDEMFGGSVVYITEHSSENGAIGVIVNKPLSNKTLKSAFEDIDMAAYNPCWDENPLYLGGPMKIEDGFVLNRVVAVNRKLFELTNDRNVLDKIAKSRSNSSLFVSAGYASWKAFQVEEEIRENTWLVVQAHNSKLIFDVDPADRYREAMRLLGIKNVSQLYCHGEVFA